MATDWTCFTCHSPNDLTSKYCSVCGAQRPPVADSLETIEARDSLTESVPAPPEKVEAETDMLAGLASLIRAAANGKITPADFARRMSTASGNIDKAYAELTEQINQLDTSGDNEEYAQSITTALDDSHYLFSLAFRELEGFGRRKDMTRLRIGMLLAEKAEDCFQAVLRGIQHDAEGHNLQGHTDVIRTLAFQVLEGSITLEQYREAIGVVDEGVHTWLRSGTEKIEAGLATAKLFDGSQFSAIDKVGQMMEEATDDLANVILAVHTPEAINEAVENIAQ